MSEDRVGDDVVSIYDIQPFDDDHVSFAFGFLVKPYNSLATLKHRATIDLMKVCISECQDMLPIAVKDVGEDKLQRLDGFCRYWALKELGIVMIPVVYREEPGCQSGELPFIP